MKTILVTGGSGFIGSALVDSLIAEGYDVVQFNSSDGDISEINFVQLYEGRKIDYIFHLASKTFIPASWDNPTSFYRTTVLGTQNILEFCRVKNIPLIFISAYLYGEIAKLPISEDDTIKPNNPYAHSKYLAEELCKFYSKYYNVKVTIARPFNIYGKNQKEIFLIPYIINQVLNNKIIKVKDLKPKRDYIYLVDLIDGLIKLLNYKKEKFSIFNFGSGKSLSVDEVIVIIQKIVGTNKKVVSKKEERKNEIMNVVADISKSKTYLNWQPKYSFEDGIKELIIDNNTK